MNARTHARTDAHTHHTHVHVPPSQKSTDKPFNKLENKTLSLLFSCADPESFLRGGPTLTTFFFSWWWEGGSKYNYKRAIIDPPAKRHLNGVLPVGPWWPNIGCWLGSFVVLQGIRISIAKKTIFFVIFKGGGVRTPCPPLWIRTWFWLVRPSVDVVTLNP